ncbi:MAG: DUF3619 family protein [Pseudohongiellaceae bacterium]
MTEKKTDQQFVDNVKQELDKSCDRLDGQTLSRLNFIRHQVLENAHTGNQAAFYRRSLLSGGVLAACVLALVISLNFNRDAGSDIDIALSELEDMEILSAEESFELYEDMEFYQWLSMNGEF